MYIIDKNKDFYDYLSHIYGEDKAITFDRRGSEVVDDLRLVKLSERWTRDLHKDSTTFVLLEIGNTQYLIQLYDFVIKDDRYNLVYNEVTSCSMKLVRKFSDYKHRYDSPISVRGVDVAYQWRWRKPRKYNFDRPFDEVIDRVDEKHIDLPILKGTQVTSFVDAQEAWIALQTYFSSLGNDRDVDIPMTDVEKAEVHGFDKKTSFRNPIK